MTDIVPQTKEHLFNVLAHTARRTGKANGAKYREDGRVWIMMVEPLPDDKFRMSVKLAD